MTDTTRDLLISLASHMAYMQGQLEAHHEHDDPEGYYWYRESVLLRQKVTDALLADEPAVPEEGREPAAVITEPSDEEGPSVEEVEELCEEHCFNVEGYESIECLQGLINEAIARWGNLKGSLTSSPPADADESVQDGPGRQRRSLHAQPHQKDRVMTALSPAAAAAAVRAAYSEGCYLLMPHRKHQLDGMACPGLSAALRAAADQVVPEGGVFLSTAGAARIRRDLLAIAAELER